MMIAVAVDDVTQRDKALDVLQRLGARDLERAEGTISGGDWRDFDPNSLPVPV
ncbi:hypothetical protein [Duganella sp. P38]|uniref:hypothetical protein n=1 Tax=Duganella sp. P38 TaxID=3423949 RepID=UPI003D7A73AA